MRCIFLFLALLLAAPFTQAQKPSDANKSDIALAVGTWNYTSITPQQTYEGTFTIIATDNGYSGECVTDAVRTMIQVEVDGAHAMFRFDQPEMGRVTVEGNVDADDVFGGEVSVGFDTFAITAIREPTSEGLFGVWEYTVRPDDPMATGTFVLEQGDDQINGTFNTDAPRKMNDIELTDASLSFSFTQPVMGLIRVSLALEESSLTGIATVEDDDELIPMIAVRADPELDTSED